MAETWGIQKYVTILLAFPSYGVNSANSVDPDQHKLYTQITLFLSWCRYTIGAVLRTEREVEI